LIIEISKNLKQSVKLNEDMEKVQEWGTSNDMVINTMKSKSMIMGSSRKIQYLESNFNIFYDDVYHVKCLFKIKKQNPCAPNSVK
jgi:hypothetical protein